MISQGVTEQNSISSGYNRSSANSGRILETNSENLLRMVLQKSLFSCPSYDSDLEYLITD